VPDVLSKAYPMITLLADSKLVTQSFKDAMSPDIRCYFRAYKIKSVLSVMPFIVFKYSYFAVLEILNIKYLNSFCTYTYYFNRT
jgi:hypothetical protein